MIPVVSFYTENTPYETEAFEMKESAHAVGLLDVNLFKVQSSGSWARNCQQKVEILIEACEVIKEPFLYVDADARFVCPPYLMRGTLLSCYDLAVHYFKQTELLSGTIWVNPTVHTRTLLDMWQEACYKAPGIWDQKALSDVLSKYPAVDVFKLPPEYTWIFDLSPKFYGFNLEPVIVHYQASRKYKNVIGRA